MDCDRKLLVRACNQLGQFLQHKETNLRYLALESLCLLATSEFSHEAVKKHQETIVNALKVSQHFLFQGVLLPGDVKLVFFVLCLACVRFPYYLIPRLKQLTYQKYLCQLAFVRSSNLLVIRKK